MKKAARTWGLALATVLAATVATVGPMSGAGAAAGDDPMIGAPEVGDCYALTAEQANSDSMTRPPVDCGRTHTLLLGAVGEVPATFDWEDSGDRFTWSNKICNPF